MVFESTIAWNARTHSFILDVWHKKVLIAKTSQYLNHLSLVKSFSLFSSQFPASQMWAPSGHVHA
jgi:hypothetical protein